MDIFIEEIVERKRSFKQIAASFGILLLSLIVAFALFVFLPALVPMLSGLVPFFVIAVFYIAYRLVVAQNLEYEYSLVNTEMDVDKIINRKGRKRLTTVKVTGLEAYGVCGEEHGEFNRYLSDMSVKKIYASAEKNSDTNFFVVYMSESVKTMLIFNPSEKIVNNIKKFNPKR